MLAKFGPWIPRGAKQAAGDAVGGVREQPLDQVERPAQCRVAALSATDFGDSASLVGADPPLPPVALPLPHGAVHCTAAAPTGRVSAQYRRLRSLTHLQQPLWMRRVCGDKRAEHVRVV